MLSQFLWITFARNNIANDLHSRLAGDVVHNVMKLDVHLRQRLLHVLRVGRRAIARDDANRRAMRRSLAEDENSHATTRTDAAAESIVHR